MAFRISLQIVIIKFMLKSHSGSLTRHPKLSNALAYSCYMKLPYGNPHLKYYGVKEKAYCKYTVCSIEILLLSASTVVT